MRQRTNVYVDGFNLYYGLKRRAEEKGVPNTEYRWLDLVALAKWLLPNDHIGTVRYFTAKVKGRYDNEASASRQEIFIRALETRGDVKVFHGKFQRNTPHRQLVSDPAGQPAHIIEWKEKRSDVTLASYLLQDAYEKQCTRAALVSSDSDFVRAVEIAHRKLPDGVIVLDPNTNPSKHLRRAAGGNQIHIPEEAFRECQLPIAVLSRDRSPVRRPQSW